MRTNLLAALMAVLVITGIACFSSGKSELVNTEELTSFLPPGSHDISPVSYDDPREFGVYREAAGISFVTSLSDAEVIAWYKQKLGQRGWTFVPQVVDKGVPYKWEHKTRDLEFFALVEKRLGRRAIRQNRNQIDVTISRGIQ